MKIHLQFNDPKRPLCRVSRDSLHPRNITRDTTRVTCKKCLSMIWTARRQQMKQRLESQALSDCLLRTGKPMKFELHSTHTRYFTVIMEASSAEEAHKKLRERLAWSGLAPLGGEPEIREDAENQYDFRVVEDLTKQLDGSE